MESNKASEYRNLAKIERRLLRLLAQLELEDDARNARSPHAQSPTSTPRTFLFLGCLPMPLPRVVQEEVLLMVPAFFRKLVGWKNCKAAPATKPAEPASPKAKGFGGDIGKATATEVFDAFFGCSSNGKTVGPTTQPAGSAGPKAKGFGDEIGKATATEVFDAFFGRSSNGKTVAPATKPAAAGPNAKGLGCEIGQTAVSGNVIDAAH